MILKDEQIIGKQGSRSADHLTIVRFLIEKYALKGGKRLYACFFDLKKAFDTVDRTMLFHKLLNNYHIGGKFLKLLREMYENNKMFIKLAGGLTHPFITTLGVKQGCVLSPLIFNLFINDLPDHFDDQCDPVMINDQKLNCLMFADDVMVLSQSSSGLKRAIHCTAEFFSKINLSVNLEKTQVMVFNARGVQLDTHPQHHFHVGDQRLKVVAEYTYLGVLRYKKVPEERRYCQYCTPTGGDNNLRGYLDNEQHFLTSCSSFTLKRNCLFSKLDTFIRGFSYLSSKEKTAILLCPTSLLAKLSNKYIQIMFKTIQLLDDGVPAFHMGYGAGIVPNEFYDIDETNDNDCD